MAQFLTGNFALRLRLRELRAIGRSAKTTDHRRMYIVIDGDDSGRKITACYINNDEIKLRRISENLERATRSIAELLKNEGFRVIFRAADGVTAAIDDKQGSFSEIFEGIRRIAYPEFTFSVGVGGSLREAYLALLNAKCAGKDKYSIFSDID